MIGAQRLVICDVDAKYLMKREIGDADPAARGRGFGAMETEEAGGTESRAMREKHEGAVFRVLRAKDNCRGAVGHGENNLYTRIACDGGHADSVKARIYDSACCFVSPQPTSKPLYLIVVQKLKNLATYSLAGG